MMLSTQDPAAPQVVVARTDTTKNPEIFGLQYLRAAAAFMVLLVHTSATANEGGLLKTVPNFDWGIAGVDLFFVISGFVMLYSTGGRNVGPREFYLRRLARLVPLYFVATSVAVLLAKLAPQAVRTFSPHFADYVRSLLFIPFYNATLHLNQPVIGQGWTLDFEVFFYFWFGALLLFTKKVRSVLLPVLFASLVAAGYVFRPKNVPLAFYTNSIILEFVLGVVVCYIFQRIKMRSGLLGLMITACGIAMFFVFSHFKQNWDPNLGYHATYTAYRIPRAIFYGIPSAISVMGVLLLERSGWIPRMPLLLALGDASYSAYIWHTFILAVVRRIWAPLSHMHGAQAWWLFYAVAVTLIESFAVLSFRYLEVPAMQRLTDAFKRRQWIPASR